MVRNWLAVVAIVICVLPRHARACGQPEPPPPALNGVEPSSGEHPNNVPIRISGTSLNLGALTVTVDGQPAMAAPASSSVFLIEPTPEPGQQIHLSGQLCNEGCVVDVTLTAGPPDLEAPPPPTAIFLNIHDYPNIPSNDGSCQYGSDLAFYIDVETEGHQGDANRVEVFAASNPGQVLYGLTGSVNGTHSARLGEQTLAGVDPNDLCVRTNNFDLAGNASTSIESCGLCKYRVDSGSEGQLGDPAPPQPTWHSGDLVADGTCPDATLPEPPDSGGSETGSETGDSDSATGELDGDSGGCGCQAATPPAPLAALALLGLIWLPRRRR